MRLPGIESLLDLALAEDLAFGDITTDALFSTEQQAKAVFRCRQQAVVSGLDPARRVFEKLDTSVRCTALVQNGNTVQAGTDLMIVEGPVSTILKGERLALNLMQHLSGVATLTRRFVDAVSRTGTRITHTRKTLPGLRALEIAAVLDGGGSPHRFSLSHAVLIKDNHIQAAGGISQAVEAVRRRTGHTVRIEVECDTLEQVDEALNTGIDLLLLDNMPLATLAEAVRRAKGRAVTEASGGVTLETVQAIAQTGVDIISTSQITLSAQAVDIGLDFE